MCIDAAVCSALYYIEYPPGREYHLYVMFLHHCLLPRLVCLLVLSRRTISLAMSHRFSKGVLVVLSAVRFLAINPDIAVQVQLEIQNVLATSGRTELHGDDLEQLNLCKMVILETLRLAPPSPMLSRKTTTPMAASWDGEGVFKLEAAGLDTPRPCTGHVGPEPVNDAGPQSPVVIPAGTNVVIPVQSIHTMPEFWANAHQWIPQRFQHVPAPGTFLPFGSGPRVCPARDTAVTEAVATLAVLVQHFEFGSAPYLEGQTTFTVSRSFGQWRTDCDL